MHKFYVGEKKRREEIHAQVQQEMDAYRRGAKNVQKKEAVVASAVSSSSVLKKPALAGSSSVLKKPASTACGKADKVLKKPSRA